MNKVVGVVLVHLDLFHDDAALLLDVRVIEGWVQHQVGKHVHGVRQVLVQNLDVEADALLGGKGVQVSTEGIDLAGDHLGGARGGALEDHVFGEVGDSVDLRRLVARAGPDPNSGGHRADLGHLFADDGETVGQDCPAGIAQRGIQVIRLLVHRASCTTKSIRRHIFHASCTANPFFLAKAAGELSITGTIQSY